MNDPEPSGDEQSSNMNDHEPSGDEQRGNINDSEPSGDELRSNMNDPEPSGDEQSCNMNDPEPSGDEQRGNINDSEPSGDELRSNMNDPEPSGDELSCNMNDPEPSGDEQRGNINDSEPSGDELRSNLNDPEPSGDELRSNVNDPEPSAGGQSGNVNDSEPAGDELRSNINDPEPSGDEQSGNVNDSEPSAGGQSGNVNDPKPSGDEQRSNKDDPGTLGDAQSGNMTHSEPSGVAQIDNINNHLPLVFRRHIRDPSSDSGYREADDAYNRFFEEYFPDYKENIHKIPPVYFGNHSYSTKRGLPLDETEPIYPYHKAESDTAGEKAEKCVADFIERKLLKELKEKKGPAFLIMSYQFKHFCHKTDQLPRHDENKYVKEDRGAHVAAQEVKDGEHDLLIIHYQYGVIFVQVKSTQENTNPNNTTKAAIDQTKKDEEFFEENFKDLDLNITISSVIALPDINMQDLDKKNKQNCKRRLVEFGLNHCLFKNHFENEETDGDIWWSELTNGRTGFDSLENYKRVVARYIGYKSTVEIPLVRHQKSLYKTLPDGRRFGDCVAAVGNECANIVLTPEQVYILVNTFSRLVIHGDFGTGKTVLLILKVRHLLRCREKVCVITMCSSPLKEVLEKSINNNMEQFYFTYLNVLKFEHALKECDLSEILKDCAENKCHVFVDEFPSFTRTDQTLKEVIKTFPERLMMWFIMSRETNMELSEVVNEMFEKKPYCGHSQTLGFIRLFMSKMLRCPPTVMSVLPRIYYRQEKTIANYDTYEIIKDPGTKRKLATYFHFIGLSTSEIKKLSTEPQRSTGFEWADVVVVDKTSLSDVVESRATYTVLSDLGLPLVTPAGDTYVNKVLFATECEFKGFCRREVIVFGEKSVTANPVERICEKGPDILFLYHTQHDSALQDCCICENDLRNIITKKLRDCSQTESQQAQSNTSQVVSENLLDPRLDLTLADFVIIDTRREPECIAALFQKCGLPVVNKLDAETIDMAEMFSPKEVMYIKPHMFAGLEKKVVFVVRKNSESMEPSIRLGCYEDPIKLALTRHTSQLVIIYVE